MTDETMQISQPEIKAYAIGQRLKSAREALGMDKKDVASQLRLHENVITMLEKDELPNSLPTIFIRGYIRAYGKFLELPDYEIKEALAPIQAPAKEEPKQEDTKKNSKPIVNKKLAMKTVNFAIAITLVSLVWQWWHTHNVATIMIAEKNLAIPFDNGASVSAQQSASSPVVQSPINTGNPTTAQAIKIPLAPQVGRALAYPGTSSPAAPVVATATAQPSSMVAQPDASMPQKKPIVIAKNSNTQDDDDDDDDGIE